MRIRSQRMVVGSSKKSTQSMPSSTPVSLEEPARVCGTRGSFSAKKRAVAQLRCGLCPICRVPHTYQRQVGGGGTVDWPSERLSSCPRFLALSGEERLKTVESLDACCRCLSWRHGPEGKCRGRRKPCKAPVPQGTKCWASHHSLIHGAVASTTPM